MSDNPSGAANATADRAIDILLLFTMERPLWTALEISRHFGMPRSTTYRYLNSLRSYALIREDESGGGFRLGSRIFPLARVAKAGMSVVQIAGRQTAAIAERFSEIVTLYERVGHDILNLDRIESPHRVSLASTRSHLLPWPATASAKVLLAFAPGDERKALLQMLQPVAYTSHTIKTRSALLAELEAVRAQGYAITDEERDEGTWGAAAPVFSQGQARYCLAVVGPKFRIGEAMQTSIIESLKTATAQVTAELEAMHF